MAARRPKVSNQLSDGERKGDLENGAFQNQREAKYRFIDIAGKPV